MRTKTEKALNSFPLPSEVVLSGVSEGIVWVIARGVVGLNGYVRVPDNGHPWSKEFPADENGWGDWGLDEYLSVHGGVTFAKHPWIGFDTAHAGDNWSAEYDPRGLSDIIGKSSFGGELWTEDKILLETLAMANQLAAIR